MGYASDRFRAKRRQALGLDKPKPYDVAWRGGPVLDLGVLVEPRTTHEQLLGTEPTPELKGILNGNCNRSACQRPGADWFNTSTRKYYCRRCAHEINKAGRDFGEPAICFLSEGYEADQAMKFGDQR